MAVTPDANENKDLMGPVTEAKIKKLFGRQKDISKRGLSQQYENTESAWKFLQC